MMGEVWRKFASPDTKKNTMPLQTIEKQIFNRLTKLYLVALLAVAMLSVVGQLVIQLFLTESLNDAHVVNIAGRQRMLSQKLAKTATLICKPVVINSNSAKYKNELKGILALWSQSHKGLMNGKLLIEKGLKVKNSPTINHLFKILNPVFEVIYANAYLLCCQSGLSNIEQNDALKIILSNEKKFLEIMNNIVSEYDLEAQNRVNKTKSIELLLFTLLFGVLFIEGLFIFKPIANNIRLVIKALTASESNLKTVNADLLESNMALNQTKKELITATEEKYKLQLAEEKVRSSSLIEGQEVERKRLALELHDGIGQMLTGLKLQSEHLKSFKFVNEKQQKSFDDLQNLIGETIIATRSVSFNLAPSVLSDFGLLAAIRLLAEQYQKAGRIPIKIKGSFNQRLSEKIEIGLYRIVQEAIHNAQKYSNAKLINILLEKKESSILLQIADNGDGFDITSKNKTKGIGGTGIGNMHTRVELLNGSFEIHSTLNMGTKITVQIPS
jgi:signal transduction histidine kinase